jgi:hypothetical protein
MSAGNSLKSQLDDFSARTYETTERVPHPSGRRALSGQTTALRRSALLWRLHSGRRADSEESGPEMAACVLLVEPHAVINAAYLVTKPTLLRGLCFAGPRDILLADDLGGGTVSMEV